MKMQEWQQAVPLEEARGIMLPGTDLTIDKDVAYTIVRLYANRKLELFFWRINQDPTPGQIERFAGKKIVPVDIGSLKYHSRIPRLGSATEAIITDYSLAVDPVQKGLMYMLNENNRTGFLKDHPYSVAQIRREAFKLSYKPEQVLEMMRQVIQAWLAVERLRAKYSIKHHVVPDPSLSELVNCTAVSRHQDFTVGQFIQNATDLHWEPCHIRRVAEFFLTVRERARKEEHLDIARFQKAQKREFPLPNCCGQKGVHLYDATFYNLPKAAFKHYGYAVVVVWQTLPDERRRMRATLTNKRLNIDELVTWAFKNAPQGSLFYDDRIKALFNGTEGLSLVKPWTPSVLEYERMIQERVRPCRKN